MTYLSDRSRAVRRYRPQRRQSSLGGLFDFVDDLIGGVVIGTGTGSIQAARDVACRADAEGAVAPMDAQIDDLKRTWNPTGFFTPDQVNTIVLTALEYSAGASSQIEETLRNVDLDSSDHKTNKREFESAYDPFSEAQKKAMLFLDAAKKAKAEGLRAVNAPGLKLWVVDLMEKSRTLAKAASFINCNRSTLERVSRTLNALLDRAISIIKRIVGVILEAGERALDVAGDFFGILLSLMKYAPYIAIGGGGLYLYKKYRDSRGG